MLAISFYTFDQNSIGRRPADNEQLVGSIFFNSLNILMIPVIFRYKRFIGISLKINRDSLEKPQLTRVIQKSDKIYDADVNCTARDCCLIRQKLQCVL